MLGLGMLLAAGITSGCAKPVPPPVTPQVQQTSALNAAILQINQNPMLTPADKERLIAQVRASPPPAATH